jgi:hypothetical protein
VKAIAPRTFKRAEIEPGVRGHDASEHHVSMTLWASGALDVEVDAIGQRMELWHDASLKDAGAQHSLSPVMRLVK